MGDFKIFSTVAYPYNPEVGFFNVSGFNISCQLCGLQMKMSISHISENSRLFRGISWKKHQKIISYNRKLWLYFCPTNYLGGLMTCPYISVKYWGSLEKGMSEFQC